jgi:hypothetical protein
MKLTVSSALCHELISTLQGLAQEALPTQPSGNLTSSVRQPACIITECMACSNDLTVLKRVINVNIFKEISSKISQIRG